MSETVVEYVKRADTSSWLRKPLAGTGALADAMVYGSQRDDVADLAAFLPIDAPASERTALVFRKATEEEIRTAGMKKVGDDDKYTDGSRECDCVVLNAGLALVHNESPTESKLTDKNLTKEALQDFKFSSKHYHVLRDKDTMEIYYSLNFIFAPVKRKYSATLHQRLRAAAGARGIRLDAVTQVQCALRGENIAYPEWPKEAFKPKTRAADAAGKAGKEDDEDDPKPATQETDPGAEDASPSPPPPRPPPGLVPKSETQKRKADAAPPAPKPTPAKKAKEAKEASVAPPDAGDAKAELGKKLYECFVAFKAAYPESARILDQLAAYARKTAGKESASRTVLHEDDCAGKTIDELIAQCQKGDGGDKAKEQMLKLKYTLTMSNFFWKDMIEPPPPPAAAAADIWL
jgi:hypothetical protein